MTISLYPTSSTALLAPVNHITPNQKEELLGAVAFWWESLPHTEYTDYIAARDRLLIEWLWHTGMRVSDALNIKFDDINNETETVRFIVSKRSRKAPFVHEIMLSKAMMFEVMKYWNRWRHILESHGHWMFLSTRRTTKEGSSPPGLKPMTRQGVNERLKTYRRIARLPSVSAHTFRHGCAMNLLNQGVSSHAIAFRLAHSSTQVTESVYARMNVDIERKMLETVAW